MKIFSGKIFFFYRPINIGFMDFYFRVLVLLQQKHNVTKTADGNAFYSLKEIEGFKEYTD